MQTEPYLFDLHLPHTKTIGLLAIPHAGEWIPDPFLPYLTKDLRAMLEDVDFRVPDLIDIHALLKQGIALIMANVHRVAVDLNRPEDKSVLHWELNTKGIPLKTHAPDSTLEQRLRVQFHRPYYDVIKDILQNLEKEYPQKKIPFVDLHSMPSRPTEYHLRLNPHQKMDRADFCISDLKGESCEKKYIQTICNFLERKGYAPVINDPYFGGYGTQFAHQFQTNAIQIEINRRCYMNEELKCLRPELIGHFKTHLTDGLIDLFNTFSPSHSF